MSDRSRKRNHLRWVGGLLFSFSLAASGWLHIQLHSIKKKAKKSFSCFCWWRTKPSSSSSTGSCSLLECHLTSPPIISASLCRAQSLLYGSKSHQKGSVVFRRRVPFVESRIFAPVAIKKHHMVTESNIHNCYGLLNLTKKKKDINAHKC